MNAVKSSQSTFVRNWNLFPMAKLTSSGQKLGIEVKPSDIRLDPRANDPYAWKILPRKEHSLSGVFAKNLSDHSIGTFRLLCNEVGKTFEAVLSSTQSSSLDSIIPVCQVAQSISGDS
jgi:hypothetical protein